MKKILFCASTISHIKNFHLPYLQMFQEAGYEVWVAADKVEAIPYADHVVALPLQKKLTSLKNVKAIFEMRKLLKQEHFEKISTHTALASAVARAAVLFLKKRPHVFCTVHGYLFNKEGGLKKWIYLLPEKICACVTDTLMVMNQEDYEIAQQYKLYGGQLYYINGMGIDFSKFTPITLQERFNTRKALGLGENDFAFVYAAEFSKRKNHAFLIKAFSHVCKKAPQIKLLLAGTGAQLEACKQLSCKLGCKEQVLFLGYVNGMQALYRACDACVTASHIEGLPFNVMEAMACGLPVVASKIKGHQELVAHGKNGYLFRVDDSAQLEEQLLLCSSFKRDEGSSLQPGFQNQEVFSLPIVKDQIQNIYGIV